LRRGILRKTEPFGPRPGPPRREPPRYGRDVSDGVRLDLEAASAFLGTIPSGRWTSDGDVAVAAGRSSKPVSRARPGLAAVGAVCPALAERADRLGVAVGAERWSLVVPALLRVIGDPAQPELRSRMRTQTRPMRPGG